MQRSRYRRRCQGQHVNIRFQLLQLFLVRNPKTLLLVDDKQSELFVRHVLAKQPVGANNDINTSLPDFFNRLLLFLCRPKSRKHPYFYAKIPHPLYKRIIVLSREYRRRHKHRYLPAIHHRLEGRPQCDLRFAVTDVTANKTVHNSCSLHIIFRVLDCMELVLRLLIRKQFFKFFLPHRVLFKGMPLPGLPLCVQFHKLTGNLLYRPFHPGFRLFPFR